VDVKGILDNAEAEANLTAPRAIRLPEGFPRTNGKLPSRIWMEKLFGLRRMDDSTVFSIDVAASKARNMVYFNSSARSAADLNGRTHGDGSDKPHDKFWFAAAVFRRGIDDSTIFAGAVL